MRKVKALSVLFILSLVFALGCQKELTNANEFVPDNNSPNISMNVAGRVIDEQGKPVQGAQVVGINGSATTNINGEFVLKNIRAYDKAAFVQVNKSGYFTGSRTFVATEGQTHYIEVELLKNTSSGSIDATTGGTVSLSSGASVTLPASSVVVKSSNAPYTGQVEIALKWIDPTSEALPRQMPGDLRGINENNAEVGLQSFGMLAVELTSPSGEALQVAPGKKASLKFPVPAAIASSAPATVPLWSFNNETGLWKYEGIATKAGNHYAAEVSHFSFWNCDAQFPVVDFKATIKDQNGNPVKHALVKLKRTANNTSGYGYTDTIGVVKGKVPPNEALVLEVFMPYNACNIILHTQNIGPFASSASINVIVTVSPAQMATVSGSVINCSGTPLTSGLVDMVVGSRVYRTSINNGNYSFSVMLCGAGQTATLLAIDSATNQQGLPTTITLNAGANTAPNLAACGTVITQFINYSIGGTTGAFLPPTDSLLAYSTASQGTWISGTSNSIATSAYSQLNFAFNGSTTGSFPLISLSVRSGGTIISLTQSSPISVTVTEFGAVGGYIAGSFNGIVNDQANMNLNIPIQCNFRVRRLQ